MKIFSIWWYIDTGDMTLLAELIRVGTRYQLPPQWLLALTRSVWKTQYADEDCWIN